MAGRKREAPSRAPKPLRMGSMEKRPPLPAMLPMMSGAASTPGYSCVVKSMREAISPARSMFKHTCADTERLTCLDKVRWLSVEHL